MANLSLQEITDVLNKSGAQGGSAFDMAQNKPTVEQGVRSTVYGQGQPILDNAKSNYLAQIHKIAAMDGKLAGVYGDPTSPLYIERASRRDSAVHGGDSANYSAAKTHADIYTSKKKELEDSIKQTMSVYSELTQLTKAQETEAAKNTKDEARVAAGKGKFVTTATGQKVVTPVYKGKAGKSGGGIQGNGKLTKEQQNAGFQDYNAANSFSTKEAAFRKQWVDKVQQKKAAPPQAGYSQDDLNKRYEAWKKANPSKKKGSTSGKSLF